MKYRIFFYSGNELTLKTNVSKGHATLNELGLSIEGPENTFIPVGELREVTLFRLHGLGRVIQVDHLHGRIFVSVVRFMIGQFALINFLKTGSLHRDLSALLSHGS